MALRRHRRNARQKNCGSDQKSAVLLCMVMKHKLQSHVGLGIMCYAVLQLHISRHCACRSSGNVVKFIADLFNHILPFAYFSLSNTVWQIPSSIFAQQFGCQTRVSLRLFDKTVTKQHIAALLVGFGWYICDLVCWFCPVAVGVLWGIGKSSTQLSGENA